MRRMLFALILIGTIIAPSSIRAQESGAAESRPARQWNAETVLLQPRVAAAEISPDGQKAVYLRSRPRTAAEKPGAAFTQLLIADAAGGEPFALTAGDAVDAFPAWSPDGKDIAFISLRADSPKRQVYLISSTGGTPRALTDAKTGVTAFKWSPDGAMIAYVAIDPPTDAELKDQAEGRDWTIKGEHEKPSRLWVLDVNKKIARPVASAGNLSVYEFAWSPDAKEIVANVAETPAMDDSYMNKRTVALPVGDGKLREIAKLGGKIGEVAWSPDGQTIAFCAATERSDPYQGSLFSVPAAGGAPKHLSAKLAGHVMALAWRKDGTIAALAHEGTKSTIRVYKADAPESTVAVAKGPVVFTTLSVSADGTRFAAVGSSAEHPNEVFLGGFDPAQAPARITRTTPAIEALPRGKQETVSWPAKDGLPIEGVLIYPIGYEAGKRYPLVCCVHGGPESHEPDNWKTTDYIRLGQAAAERGWFILYPNYRGSTGRGVKFSTLDHGDLGGMEFDDVVDGVDFLVQKGLVDPKKVGAIGGSYGGYFTAWAVTKLSDRFAAGVEHFGIANWLSFMGQTDIPTENELVHMAKPFYENFDLYWDRSPIRWIKNAKTPTIVMQGAADDRVPKPQADELWQALKRNGVPTEYVLYPREGHGYRERAHVIDAFDRGIAWFEKYLN